MLEGYTNAKTYPAMGSATIDEILATAREMKKLADELHDVVIVMVPRGSKVVALTPDGRILHAKTEPTGDPQ